MLTAHGDAVSITRAGGTNVSIDAGGLQKKSVTTDTANEVTDNGTTTGN